MRFEFVVVDISCVKDRLCKVDPDCELMGLMVDAFGGRVVMDKEQLSKIDCCQNTSPWFCSTSDEEVAGYILNAPPDLQPKIKKIAPDPADLRLLFFCVQNKGKSVLIACDKALLYAAHGYDVPHYCFKAAAGYANQEFGGQLSAQFAWNVITAAGVDPFLNEKNNRYCSACDPKKRCYHNKQHSH
jgi:hypothetical protein